MMHVIKAKYIINSASNFHVEVFETTFKQKLMFNSLTTWVFDTIPKTVIMRFKVSFLEL